MLSHEGFMSHLKSRPVHMHPRAMVVVEPLQILLCVCSQDCALQFSVYCGIAEERKVEHIVRTKVPEEIWGAANLATEPTMFKIGLERDPTLGQDRMPVSL